MPFSPHRDLRWLLVQGLGWLLVPPGFFGVFLWPQDPSVSFYAPRALRFSTLLLPPVPSSAFKCPQCLSVPFSAPSALLCLLVPPGPTRTFGGYECLQGLGWLLVPPGLFGAF